MFDEDPRQKWQRIKEALEKAGKTDSHYYRRAVAIVSGRADQEEKRPF